MQKLLKRIGFALLFAIPLSLSFIKGSNLTSSESNLVYKENKLSNDTSVHEHDDNWVPLYQLDFNSEGDYVSGTLSGGSSESESKCYYLTENITLSSNDITISDYVTLCLNGYMLTGTNTNSVISISSDAYLYLYDCIGDEQNDVYAHNYYVNSDGMYVFKDCEPDCQDDTHYDHSTLYGGVITNGGSTQWGGGIRVYSSAILYMYGGTIAGNQATSGGGGVYVDGKFYMEGGTISGNYTQDGGGVRSGSSGNININNGTISENTATSYGGGVYISGSSATLNMYNGTISKNTASSNSSRGGGVYSGSGSTIYIYNGTISNNTSSRYGGGVFMESSTFYMYNGTISNNNAPSGEGVYINYYTDRFNVYGGYFNDEIYAYHGGFDNVFHFNGGYYSTTAFNSIEGYLDTANYIKVDISTFGKDFDNYYLEEYPHAVYAKSTTDYSVDNVVDATYGTEYTPTINNVLGTEYTSVAYARKDSDDNEISGLPTNAGEYTVTAHFLYTTIEGYITTNYYGTTEFNVSISRDQAVIGAVSNQSKIYDGEAANIDYKVIVGELDITDCATITWYDEEGVPISTPTEVGTYNAIITVSGTDNYYGTTAFVKYTITEQTTSSTPSDGEGDTDGGDTGGTTTPNDDNGNLTTSSDPTGLSGGAIAGIVIGSLLGAVALAYGVCALLYMKNIVKGKFFETIYPFIKK